MKGYGEEMGKDWLQGISEEVRVQKLVETNEFTGRYGLTLSEQDAKLLLRGRQESLKAQRRVEFGEGILPKLIFCFCDSPRRTTPRRSGDFRKFSISTRTNRLTC